MREGNGRGKEEKGLSMWVATITYAGNGFGIQDEKWREANEYLVNELEAGACNLTTDERDEAIAYFINAEEETAHRYEVANYLLTLVKE
jgi:hypothetical protein